MLETIVDIHQLTGSNINKEYALTDESIKTYIVPSSNESIALYEDMASGQLFSYRIINANVVITPQTKFIVKASQMSDFDEDSVFITVGDMKRQRIGGNFYISGTCYKSENAN